MKKLISIILTFGCLSLGGCAALDKLDELDIPPVPTAEAVSESSSSEPSAAKLTETDHQHIIVNMERTALEAYDPQQGTELILSFSYETPHIHIPANPEAEENINEFLAMLSESYYTGDDYGVVYDSGCAPGYINMLTMAEDNYNYIINSAAVYDSETMSFELANHRTLSVQRLDDKIFSLRFYDYVNAGGVHGSYAYRGYNFDTSTGALVTLDDLSDDPDAFKAFLASYMIERVAESEELQQRMLGIVDGEGLPSTEEALTALVREGSWYVDDKGMYIFSDLYELGPYAAVIMEFFVPYNALEKYIKAEYLPETITESGLFSVVPVEAMSESSKEIIDMLRLSDEGEAIYLLAEGTVSNVRIIKVDYADRFYETETLWQCSSMTDCGLQLITRIPEGMPELKISYKDSQGEHSYYLSQSGVDGSIALVGDDIEAVG